MTRRTTKKVASKKETSTRRKPPARRGRRGHKEIDQQEGLRELIDEWLLEQPRPTYDEMVARLKGTAYHLSRSTLAKYGFDFEIRRRELRQQLEKAKLLRTEDPEDVLALEDAITHILNVGFLEQLLEDKPLTKGEIELAKAHARLQSSSAQRERTRLAVTRGVNSAVRMIRAELTEFLRDDEKLLRAVLAKVEQARAKLFTSGGGS